MEPASRIVRHKSTMTMIASMRPYPRWMLLAATVLVTASCGVRAAGPGAPGGSSGSAAPSAPATTGSPAPTTSASTRSTPPKPDDIAAMVFGTIRINPSCPVDPVHNACRPHPLGNIEVQALAPSAGVASARVAASAMTAANGRFSLRLKRGNYVLVVVLPGPFPRCPHRPVSIRSATALRADITCRSGNRLPGAAATNQA